MAASTVPIKPRGIIGIGRERRRGRPICSMGTADRRRLFVFNSLQNWLSEFRIYRRDEKGKIVKQNDHLMDATRYLIVSGLQVACREPCEEDDNGGLPSLRSAVWTHGRGMYHPGPGSE
jgi:hypothetical protein